MAAPVDTDLLLLSPMDNARANQIASNIRVIRQRVENVCLRVGRNPSDVSIVAVSKGCAASDVEFAKFAGQRDFGENRTTELDAKSRAVPATWHFLGRIQTNKAQSIVRADFIHSLFRTREAKALELALAGADKRASAFVQVNVTGEESKQGVEPAELKSLLNQLKMFDRIDICGLTFVAPKVDLAEDVRWAFRATRELAQFSLEKSGLSMGMTEDFEVAIEEGATVVRIGRAIFREE